MPSVVDVLEYKDAAARALFPLVDADDVKGGMRAVADVTARDAIPAGHRASGMTVYLASPGRYDRLNADLTTWSQDILATTSGSVDDSAALLALNGADLTDGDLFYRRTYDSALATILHFDRTQFIYDATSTASADGVFVFEPADGVGRFLLAATEYQSGIPARLGGIYMLATGVDVDAASSATLDDLEEQGALNRLIEAVSARDDCSDILMPSGTILLGQLAATDFASGVLPQHYRIYANGTTGFVDLEASVCLRSDVSLVSTQRRLSTMRARPGDTWDGIFVAFLAEGGSFKNGYVRGMSLLGRAEDVNSPDDNLHGCMSVSTLAASSFLNWGIEDNSIQNFGSYAFGHQYGDGENTSIKDNYIQNIGADGIDFKSRSGTGAYGATNVGTVITGNMIIAHGQATDLYYQAGIDVRGQAVVTDNTIMGFGSDHLDGSGNPNVSIGIRTEDGTGGSGDLAEASRQTIVSNNVITGIPTKFADGIWARHGANCLYEGNIVTDCANKGISAEPSGGYGFGGGSMFRNNKVNGACGGTADNGETLEGTGIVCGQDAADIAGMMIADHREVFNGDNGKAVDAQTVFVVTDGFDPATVIVTKNGATLTAGTDYALGGDNATITLTVGVSVVTSGTTITGDEITIIRPTRTAYSITGTGCSVGGSYENAIVPFTKATPFANDLSRLGFLPSPALNVRPTLTADATLTQDDRGGYLTANPSSAQTITITLDPNVFDDGEELLLANVGSGTMNVAPGAGMTLLSPDGVAGAFDITERYRQVRVIFRTTAVADSDYVTPTVATALTSYGSVDVTNINSASTNNIVDFVDPDFQQGGTTNNMVATIPAGMIMVTAVLDIGGTPITSTYTFYHDSAGDIQDLQQVSSNANMSLQTPGGNDSVLQIVQTTGTGGLTATVSFRPIS